MVDLSAEDFTGSGLTYLGLPLWDSPLCNALPWLGVAADFIQGALAGGGRVLVGCQMVQPVSVIFAKNVLVVQGVSRSAACALSFLLLHRGLGAREALTQLRRARDVRPNDG